MIKLPDDVKNIIDIIKKAGYEAYAVGGCVRDKLLGKEPEDYDITTSAMPEEIKQLFRRTIDTGIQHGTVTVMIGDTGYEITTYRIDGKYEDSRHPKEVKFTRSLKEDLLRRDFTINAMAYNDEEGLVDLFNGQEDLKNKIIRCVGNPMERFNEDALRIMRAVRFSAQLGYSIDNDTLEAMKKLSYKLKNISMERIQIELVKLLISEHPEKIKLAYECGMTKVFMPEFDAIMECEQNNPHHCYTVGEHSVKGMQNVYSNKYLRLTMLLHDSGKAVTKTTDENNTDHFKGHALESKKITRTVLKRLKFDNLTINTVSKLVEYHDFHMNISPVGVRKAINNVGEELFPMLFDIGYADVLAQSEFRREEKLQKLLEVKKIYQEVIDRGYCVSLDKLMVKGQDLIEIGYSSSPLLGKELNKLLDMVLNNPELNAKDTLLNIAKEDLCYEKNN